MDKKGLAFAKVVSLVLIALCLVVLGWFLISYVNILGSETGKDVCRSRLEMVSIKPFGLDILTSLQDFCKEEPVKITDVKTKEKLFKKLADKMYNCWWRYGEGKKDFFTLGEKWLIKDNGCLECYKISFDIDIPELEKSPFGWYIPNFSEEFTKYLNDYFKEKRKNVNFYIHGDDLLINKDYRIYQYAFGHYAYCIWGIGGERCSYTGDPDFIEQFALLYPDAKTSIFNFKNNELNTDYKEGVYEKLSNNPHQFYLIFSEQDLLTETKCYVLNRKK